MTLRATVLGLLLALLISVGTYFNDWVIGQTLLIGNHLPISVFGIAALLLLLVNPLLGRLGPRAPLRGSEVVVMSALALAACGWPGSNFFRGFATVTALPAHWAKTSPSWQSTSVMSYVPGASGKLGQGHVVDWPSLLHEVEEGARGQGDTPAHRVNKALDDEGRRLFASLADDGRVGPSQVPALTRALNRALASDEFYSQAAFDGLELPARARALLEERDLSPADVIIRNRYLLVAAFPAEVLPPPDGHGALVAGGRADPLVVDTLMQGRAADNRLSVTELPWSAWWPTIRLWGSAALLLGVCALCMALIVHPQWSKRELLAYPVVKFLEETTERLQGSALPKVAGNKLFWLGFVIVFAWHSVNGLHAWFPDVPEIPRKFELWPLAKIFPNAVRVSGQYGWFAPTLFFSVIAFSFFMSTSVSFSLGTGHLLFFMLGSVMIANGMTVENDWLGTKPSGLLRFGGYLGFFFIVLYTGRRYYVQLVRAALGAKPESETPNYAVWAARVLVAAALLTVVVLMSSGLGWVLATIFVFLTLLTFLVAARIVTETGAFFLQTAWAPAGVMTALFGFEAIGPTGFLLLALSSVLLIGDPREVLMPYLCHGLKLADGKGQTPPRRIAPWLLGVMLASFGVAGVVTLTLQYNHSVIQVGNDWSTHQLPRMTFDTFARLAADSAAKDSLVEATSATGLERLALVSPFDDALLWSGIGFALVLGVAALRLRVSWWPLHPVAFLVWDSYANIMFGPSFLLGWMIKATVVWLLGARGYHAVKPLMIGIIAGELLSGLFWMGIGLVYYLTTGKTPVTYSIFPT